MIHELQALSIYADWLRKEAAAASALKAAAPAAKDVAKELGASIKKGPIPAIASGVLGTASGIGAYRQIKAGFNPQVQQAMLGQTPKPPGA